MPPKQQIPPTTKGPQHAVPCPTCGHPNDFRELNEHRAETGDFAECDRCSAVMEIVAMQNVTVVHVRRRPDIQPRPREKIGQSRTISPAQMRRLLR